MTASARPPLTFDSALRASERTGSAAKRKRDMAAYYHKHASEAFKQKYNPDGTLKQGPAAKRGKNPVSRARSARGMRRGGVRARAIDVACKSLSAGPDIPKA